MNEPLTTTGRKVVAIYGSRLLDDVIGIEIEARQTILDVARPSDETGAWEALREALRRSGECDCGTCAYTRAALARRPEPAGVGDGVTTECTQVGVHDHPFRGPHTFSEWYAATRTPEGTEGPKA